MRVLHSNASTSLEHCVRAILVLFYFQASFSSISELSVLKITIKRSWVCLTVTHTVIACLLCSYSIMWKIKDKIQYKKITTNSLLQCSIFPSALNRNKHVSFIPTGGCPSCPFFGLDFFLKVDLDTALTFDFKRWFPLNTSLCCG